jgi:hypothetical protein
MDQDPRSPPPPTSPVVPAPDTPTVRERARAPYAAPVLAELGNVTEVTQKSGGASDHGWPTRK